MADEAKTFTEEQYNAMVAERDALLGKNNELLTETKTVKTKLKAFEGLAPDEARAALTELAELKSQKKAEQAGITAEQLTKLRNEARAELEKEYQPFRSQAEELARENRTLKLDNVVKQQMGKGGVRAERLDALFRLTADAFDLTDDGKPMVKSQPTLEVEKYITQELSKEYPEFFNGSGSSGGGASKSAAGGSGVVRTVPAGDNAAFLANLEGIAKGSVAVR